MLNNKTNLVLITEFRYTKDDNISVGDLCEIKSDYSHRETRLAFNITTDKKTMPWTIETDCVDWIILPKEAMNTKLFNFICGLYRA